MENVPTEIFSDLGYAGLFALFLILSFRQRKETMVIMREIVRDFTKVISNCCNDDVGPINLD